MHRNLRGTHRLEKCRSETLVGVSGAQLGLKRVGLLAVSLLFKSLLGFPKRLRRDGNIKNVFEKPSENCEEGSKPQKRS